MLVDSGQALNILGDIKKSITSDIEPILTAYEDLAKSGNNAQKVGFWTIPRIIFPEIDGVARLRYGRISDLGSSNDSVHFIREYFPRKEYKLIAGFLYEVFRHGLLHSHYPKNIIIDGIDRGWGVALSSQNVIPIHLDFMIKSKKTQLTIDVGQLYKDFLLALEKYMNEFNDQKMQTELLVLFNRGYHNMVFPMLERDLRQKKYMQNSDFDFFK